MQERISARTLGKIAMPDFCKRCFFLELKCERLPFETRMPGIFSSIDAYGKNMIHAFFEAKGILPAWFPNIGHVKEYVKGLHYSTFNHMEEETGITLSGIPDDVFLLADGSYHIVDYKTARFTERQDELLPLYEVQLNAYAFVAERIGFSPVRNLSLIYMEPKTGFEDVGRLMSGIDFSLRFSAKMKSVRVHEEGFILSLLRRAHEILKMPRVPPPSPGCQNCRAIDAFLLKMKDEPQSL